MIQHFFSKQFVLFICTGGLAALINFGSRILFSKSFSFSTAIILAYLLGMVSAFILAKLFVFKESTVPIHQSMGYFSLINLVAIAQTWVISMTFANYLLPHLGLTRFIEEISHGIGVVAPVFTSYLGHKKFSFR